MARPARPRTPGAGSIRKLPSGRWQARYRTTPGGPLTPAPVTFQTKLDAATWLRLHGEGYTPATPGPAPLLGDYAARWLALRDVAPRTRADYQRHLTQRILPTFGTVPMDRITPDDVRAWHAGIGAPVQAARAYGLLHAIYATAAADDVVPTNPCRIRGAQNPRTRTVPVILSPSDVQALTEAMPDRYRALVAVAAWCGLRFGEVTELRRGDVDTSEGVIRVRRAVTRVDGRYVVGPPKSDAGVRDVVIPPHVLPLVQHHLTAHTGREPGALLFPARHGGHLAPSTLARVFAPARDSIGRPTLRVHDLRHFAGTSATLAGASLREVQARLGHSTVGAAMRYQGLAQGRDRDLAAALSELAQPAPVPSPQRRTARLAR